MSKDLRALVEASAGEYAKTLPKHLPSERFVRVAQTALALNPELADCDRRSLMAAIQHAAEDGLLPNNREGALVVFRSRDKATGQWKKSVTWIPMVQGLLKKIRNSGQVSSISANVVYANDKFRIILGDNELIEHEPCIDGDRGPPRLVYAICRLKDGGIAREWMTVPEIEKIRSASRAKDSGPWVTHWDQMAIKTCIRRLAKKLPASTDRESDESLYRAIERDDELYEHASPRDITPPSTATIDPLDVFAELTDPETGEVQEPEPEEAPAPA